MPFITGTAREVAPDIFMITHTLRIGQVKSSVNVFALTGKDGLVFDAGVGSWLNRTPLIDQIEKVIQLKKSRGEICTITRAIPSHGHWDHFSGLAHLQKILGLRIMATQKQAEKIGSKKGFKDSIREHDYSLTPVIRKTPKGWHSIWEDLSSELFLKIAGINFVTGPIDIVDENTELTINEETWKIISVPGHSDDDIVLYNEDKGILLGGDLVLRKITTWLGPPKSDLRAYLQSLERLRQLPNLKLILPAHGNPVTNPAERISEIIRHRHQRTKDLLHLVMRSGKKGISQSEVFHAFYPKTNILQRSLLEGWQLVTLKYLIEERKINAKKRGKKTIYQSCA